MSDTPKPDDRLEPKPAPRPTGARIVLRMTAREKDDNADAIREVRAVLKAAGRALRVETVPEPEAPPAAAPVPAPAPVPDDPPRNLALEIRIGQEVELRLSQKAAAAPAPKADPAEAERVKKGLWKWLGEKLKAGWRVTVLAALEWVKKSAG